MSLDPCFLGSTYVLGSRYEHREKSIRVYVVFFSRNTELLKCPVLSLAYMTSTRQDLIIKKTQLDYFISVY